MILGAALVSILFALFYPQPERVVKWLYSQLYGTILLFAINRWYGDGSKVYLATYAVVTAIILGTVLAIVLGSLRLKQHSYRGAALLALAFLTFGRWCYVHIEHPQFSDCIGITEGSILLWAAMCLGYLVPYMKETGLAATLTGLWFCQSMFRIWFYVSGPSEWFLWLNWKLPPLLGISAFLLIGWLGRQRIYAPLRAR